MEGNALKIILADDHPIVRDALKHLLDQHDMDVIAEAESGKEVLELLDRTTCDLLILDLTMPGDPVGPELIQKVVKGREKPPPVLVFSMSDDGGLASDALRAGAVGYVTKDSEPVQILDAIHKIVAKEGKYINPAIAEKILFGQKNQEIESPPHELLSKRERQIFQMLVDGKSIDEIASELFISRPTVGTHKARLMRKLDLHNNVDMVRYAISHGIISV